MSVSLLVTGRDFPVPVLWVVLIVDPVLFWFASWHAYREIAEAAIRFRAGSLGGLHTQRVPAGW